MHIDNIRNENELINLFCTLAEIPSPSMHEEKVSAGWKINCKENSLDCSLTIIKML